MAYLGHWLPPACISWGTSTSTSILGSRQGWLKHKAALFSVLPAIWNHSGVCGARDKQGNWLRAERSLINMFECGQHCTGTGYTNQKLFHMFLTHSVRQAGITPSSHQQGWTNPAQMWCLMHCSTGCCRDNLCLLTDSFLTDQWNYLANFASFQIFLCDTGTHLQMQNYQCKDNSLGSWQYLLMKDARQ